MDRKIMDPSEGEKTTDREILEPSEGEKTTMDREAMDWIADGKGFLRDYYRTFEVNRADVANLYSEDSVMTSDGEKIQGKKAIVAKLTSLKLSRIQVLNIDCLPVGGTNLRSGFSGMVCGYIWLDGKQDARSFSQMFVLLPTPEGSFDISHSILCTGPESSALEASSEGERSEGERFLQDYCRMIEVNRADMANLYREDSVMAFDGQNIQGKEAICAKLTSLKLLRFKVLEINCQPASSPDSPDLCSSGIDHGIVRGDIWLDGKEEAFNFSQIFLLRPTPEGSFDILSSMLYIGPKSSFISSKGERTEIMGDVGEAKGFLQDYCRMFEVNRADVANLYREDSGMNFDGENIQGKEAIRAKLTSLKLSRIQVLNIDCLPVGGTDLCSGFSGMVCGYIWLDGKQDTRSFSQTFSLHPTPEGSFVISNSIFIHIGMESYGAGTGTALGSSAWLSPFPYRA